MRHISSLVIITALNLGFSFSAKAATLYCSTNSSDSGVKATVENYESTPVVHVEKWKANTPSVTNDYNCPAFDSAKAAQKLRCLSSIPTISPVAPKKFVTLNYLNSGEFGYLVLNNDLKDAGIDGTMAIFPCSSDTAIIQ